MCVHMWERVCAHTDTQKCVCMSVLWSQLSSFQSRAWLQSYVSLCREHTHEHTLSHTLQLWPTSIHPYVCIHVCMNAKEGKKQETKDKKDSWGAIWISIACHAVSSLGSHTWTLFACRKASWPDLSLVLLHDAALHAAPGTFSEFQS